MIFGLLAKIFMQERKRVIIGLSKLSCRTYELVLNQYADRIPYRGTINARFQNAVDGIQEKADSRNRSNFSIQGKGEVYPDENDSYDEYQKIFKSYRVLNYRKQSFSYRQFHQSETSHHRERSKIRYLLIQ